MISDVLSDASNEIKRYQEEHADVYEGDKQRIDRVVASMDELRVYFDTYIPGGTQ